MHAYRVHTYELQSCISACICKYRRAAAKVFLLVQESSYLYVTRINLERVGIANAEKIKVRKSRHTGG